MNRIKKLFLDLFDIKLFLTAVGASVSIFFISKFVEINFLIQVFGGILVYFLALVKNLLPRLLEKRLDAIQKKDCLSDKDRLEMNYRLNLFEKRLDEIVQTVFKVEAAIQISALDEILEDERVNRQRILLLESDVQRLQLFLSAKYGVDFKQ
jgi:hypothetical protein